MNVKKKLIIVFAAIFLALSLTSISYATSKISKPGEYSGYSEQIYDQVVASSDLWSSHFMFSETHTSASHFFI